MQRTVTVSIASSAVPRPSTVTVTPLYGCGYLLEIKTQATAGVGCLMCAFHATSLCHVAMCFVVYYYRNLLMFTITVHAHSQTTFTCYSQCAYTQYWAKQSTCVCVCAY